MNYNFSPALSAPTSQSTFYITATISCDTTTLIAPILTDMTTSVMVQEANGSPKYATYLVVFTDTVGLYKNDPSFCGEREIGITTAPSTSGSVALNLQLEELQFNATSGLLSVFT